MSKKYEIHTCFGGSPSVRNEEIEFFTTYDAAIKRFNSLVETDKNWRENAQKYGNYYYGRIELYHDGELLKANY